MRRALVTAESHPTRAARCIAGAILALLGLLALQPTAAVAQAPDTLVACYVPASGTVYRIAAPGLPSDCLAAEHARFSWARLTTAAGDLAGSFPGPSVVRLRGQPLAEATPAAGQVLTFNDGAWRPQAPAGGGVTAHAQLSGLEADDHPQYLLSNGVRQSTNGFAVTGTLGQGAIPASGPGVRMMWYPAKAAFRAGEVNGTQWDDENVGQSSVAMGQNNTASGLSSVALGNGNVASSNGAIVIGQNATASAEHAVAIGSLVHSSGTAAVALGHRTVASGDYSTALGSRASTNGHAGSFVYGDDSGLGTINATRANQFVVRAQLFLLTNNNTVGEPLGFLTTSTGAHLTLGGAWTNSSDVNRKHLFEPVDADDVLARLAALSIRRWSYRDEVEAVRHVGPTAQDFRAAFGLGGSETGIATVDADGIAMLAIQALERRTRELDERTAQVEALVAQVEALERQLTVSQPRRP
jgi:hypothetical protein